MHRRLFLALSAGGLLSARAAQARDVSIGRLEEYPAFASKRVDPRNVTVWLPPGYDGSAQRHGVLYMHDGQNLFDPARAPFGEWGVDEVLSGMIARGEAPSTIVVGVWNTPKRYMEYAPTDLLAAVPEPTRVALAAQTRGPIEADAYLDFLVHELKPFIDRTYRTRTGPTDTTTMGSSMGGLISFYAGLKHPETFGAVGCVSIHWPLGSGSGEGVSRERWRTDVQTALSDYLGRALPTPSRTRFYFDHGDQNLDANYAPYQTHVDAIFAAKGYVQGRDVLSRGFPGADHNEPSWNRRLSIPLQFLLKPAA